jgi:hypothetical protein
MGVLDSGFRRNDGHTFPPFAGMTATLSGFRLSPE